MLPPPHTLEHEIDLFVYWLGIAAVAACSAAAVLEAGRKRFDLFGLLVIALVAALGGGTMRDLLLSRTVFWIADPTYLSAVALPGLATFWLARRKTLPLDIFLIPDAIGLGLFTVIGTRVALLVGVHWIVAAMMGVITGVAGGILRDVLLNEEPVIFRGELYATAALAGALGLIVMLKLNVDYRWAGPVSYGVIVSLRLAAMRWHLRLPHFDSGKPGKTG